MRHPDHSAGKTFLLFLCGGLLAAALLAPAPAAAWYSGSRGGYGGWEGSSWGSGRYLQEQSQEFSAEQTREVQREKNRIEIQEKRDEFQKEFGESQAAIRKAARAATRAPRGFFYRAPGSTTATLPPIAIKLEVDGTTFHYDRGIFYRQLPTGFLVVPAPVGAVVDALPEGNSGAIYKGDAETYFFYFGTFFTKDGDKYKVVTPPEGTVVGYVPDGYTEIEHGESVRLEFGGIFYEPAYWEGNVIFQVVAG